MIPSINQPIAANGGSVHPLTLKLLMLSAITVLIPAHSKERALESSSSQLRQDCHKVKSRRAINTHRTGSPAIAPNSRYELWGFFFFQAEDGIRDGSAYNE